MIRLGAVPCSYWADFGHFLPNTLPKRRKNLIDLTFTTPPKLGGFEGWCYFSRIEGQFPKMSCCCLWEKPKLCCLMKAGYSRNEGFQKLEAPNTGWYQMKHFHFSKIEEFWKKWPSLKVTGIFETKNTLKMVGKFSHIQNLHFAKKIVLNDQSSPQHWSEENTAAYMGLPPPTRWSTKGANGQYKDNLDGHLSR